MRVVKVYGYINKQIFVGIPLLGLVGKFAENGRFLHMRKIWLLLIFYAASAAIPAKAQAYLGLNAGPAWGRTLEGQLLIFPKNEDWLTAFAGGGYTLDGQLWFKRKKDCLEDYRYGGWHLKFGVRNNLTTAHKEDHMFWALGIVYSRMKETVSSYGCEPVFPGFEDRKTGIVSGTLLAGYSLNPIPDWPLYQGLKIDFGVQAGLPFVNRGALIGRRGYVPGIGYRHWPIRAVHLEPFIMLRVELNKRRYGYYKSRTKKSE